MYALIIMYSPKVLFSSVLLYCLSCIQREQFDLCFPSSFQKDWVDLKVKVRNLRKFY